MSLRKNLLGISGIILTFSMVAFGQEPQTPKTTPDGTLKRERQERGERRRERFDGMRRHRGPEEAGRRGPGLGNIMRGIELTEAQREQIRAITQRRLESTKTQREELFRLSEKRNAGTCSADDEARAKALHQEIRAAMEGIRTETEGVLTAEQKSKIEELQKERMAMREQRMKERQELRNKPR
jgi:Spy/CpxP family protein refolding chaperone